VSSTLFLLQVLNGLLDGVYYLLIALGLSLIFSLGGIVNLAHGAFYAVGAYLTVVLSPHIGFGGALIASPGLVALIGILFERVLSRRFYRADPDYKRNGTTTLFAALDVATGQVIGECLPRHRAKECIRFLKKIDRIVAKHPRAPSHRRQLHDPQDQGGPGVARQASALQAALHAHVLVLAQSRRALLCRDQRQAHSARRLPQRCRAGGGHP
jgi:hypothetical protein